MTTTQTQRLRTFLAVAASSMMLFLAALPWIVATAFGPLIPPDLLATPTSYAAALGARKTATAIAESTRPNRYFILGVSPKNQEIYRCPGEGNKIGRQLNSGIAIQLFGWYQDNNGTIWFLINDDRFTRQEWIRSDSNLRISPPDFKDFLTRVTCTSL